MEFIIAETDDILVSHAGLALAGALLQRIGLRSGLDAMGVEGLKRPVMPHGEVLLWSCCLFHRTVLSFPSSMDPRPRADGGPPDHSTLSRCARSEYNHVNSTHPWCATSW